MRDNGSPENKLTIVNDLIVYQGGAAADESSQITARYDNFKAAFNEASADNDNIINTQRDTQFWHRIARFVKGLFNSKARQTQGRQTMNTLNSFFPSGPESDHEGDAPGIDTNGP